MTAGYSRLISATPALLVRCRHPLSRTHGIATDYSNHTRRFLASFPPPSLLFPAACSTAAAVEGATRASSNIALWTSLTVCIYLCCGFDSVHFPPKGCDIPEAWLTVTLPRSRYRAVLEGSSNYLSDIFNSRVGCWQKLRIIDGLRVCVVVRRPGTTVGVSALLDGPWCLSLRW